MWLINFIKSLFRLFRKGNGEVIIEKPKLTDWVIGQNTLIIPEIVVEDGNWLKYLSKPYESQWVGVFDQQNCMTQAGINCLEARLNFLLMNNLLPPEIDYAFEQFFCNKEGYVKLSTRFTAKMAGTTKQGLKIVSFWDSVRSHTDSNLNIGFVPLSLWPDPEGKFTWEEYYREIPQKIKDFAKQVLNLFDVKYEWVETGRCQAPIVTKLETALKHAPLHVTAPSCPKDYDGVQRPCGSCQGTHSRTIYNIGDYIDVLDTYDPYLRKTSLNYPQPWIIKGIIKIKS